MLLLASASPARRNLLHQAGIPHRVMVSGVEEEAIRDPDAERLVLLLAEAKARAVRERAGPGLEAADGTACEALLGCDSLLSCEGEVFGKPRDGAEAVERWERLAGRWVVLQTGHCLFRSSGAGSEGQAAGPLLRTVSTRLKLAPLNATQIARYVATGEPLDCAGGFALEGRGGLVVERIEGCWSNVIGLSLPLLLQWLPWMCLNQ